MTTNFKVTNGGLASDFSDLFIPRSIFSQGGLWAWGGNSNGELGDNTTAGKSSPVQTVASGITWKQVSTAKNIHTAGIKTDGTLWTWGNNGQGQLGDNTVAAKSSPVQTVAAGTNWIQVACGNNHTIAIKADGTLWAWGSNTNGQVGANDITHRSSPVQTVAGGTNWELVDGGRYHSAGIKTDGTLWVWGKNTNGQLGTNDIVHRSSPVQTVAGGTNWKLISCGGYNGHTAGIKTDGTLWTWGDNTFGALGDNSTTVRSSPVQTVAAGTNWKQVSVGSYYTAGIKTDGTLWSWGLNNRGQLGDNSVTDKSSPVQTITAATNWKQVSCSYVTSAAIKTDGSLWVWGGNDVGQLGTNDLTHRSSPVQTVAGGTNWKLIGQSKGQICVAITDIY